MLIAPAPTASAQLSRPVHTELGELGRGAALRVKESPGGERIAYLVVGEVGTPELRLFERATGDWVPAGPLGAAFDWSPGGDRLVFSAAGAGLPEQLWSLPLDPVSGRSSGPASPLGGPAAGAVSVSPDGAWMALAPHPGGDEVVPLVVVPTGGGRERVLARGAGEVSSLRWSPDGRWIYYAQASPDSPAAVLKRVGVEGGEPQALRRVREFLGVSGDGRFLAYVPADTALGREQWVVAVSTTEGLEVARFALARGMRPMSWAAAGWRLLAVQAQEEVSLHAASLGGHVRAPLTLGTRVDTDAAWSPDAARIAYLSLLDGRLQLMWMDASGGPRHQVPTRAEPDRVVPAWSPDGRFLAYLSGGESVLHVVEPATGAERRLAQAERVPGFAWEGGGRELVYVAGGGGRAELRAVTLGGADRRLREWPALLGDPAWARFVDEEIVVLGTDQGVFALPIRTGAPRKLDLPAATAPPGHRDVAVSRDGRRIALVTGAARRAVHLAPLDGGRGRVLASGLGAGPERIAWHPDGRHLVASVRPSPGRSGGLSLLPLDGGPARPLVELRANEEVGGFALAPGGEGIVYEVVSTPSPVLWELDLRRALAPYALSAEPRP